jgi:DNA-directed RNA polymerase subunit RPC12/RpoP
MPCYRCATRQTDPGKGPSDWKRGVLGGTQVLVCPDCQRSHDWEADLDRCTRCGSVRLVKTLGETRCKACGDAVAAESGATPVDETLAADVSAALERRFGSYPDSTVP